MGKKPQPLSNWREFYKMMKKKAFESKSWRETNTTAWENNIFHIFPSFKTFYKKKKHNAHAHGTNNKSSIEIGNIFLPYPHPHSSLNFILFKKYKNSTLHLQKLYNSDFLYIFMILVLRFHKMWTDWWFKKRIISTKVIFHWIFSVIPI